MNDQVAKELRLLNQRFYTDFAAPFDRSRIEPQPGFERTLAYLPDKKLRVLEIGCGNGRYGAYLSQHDRIWRYVGVDFSHELLLKAAEWIADGRWKNVALDDIHFVAADMGRPGFLEEFGNYDLVVCMAAMQHLPQRLRRAQLLQEMGNHVFDDGHILIANWQFMDSERQRRKIRPWDEVGLMDDDVEQGDYLLTWRRGGLGYRYVCYIDEEETAHLADAAGLKVANQFRADGREGNLSLYTFLQPPPG